MEFFHRLKLLQSSKRSADVKFEDPIDAVYSWKHYKVQPYQVSEIIQFHREANHPTMRNKPNAAVNIQIELNMVAEKKVLFVFTLQPKQDIHYFPDKIHGFIS